jgi:hypothetical protein
MFTDHAQRRPERTGNRLSCGSPDADVETAMEWIDLEDVADPAVLPPGYEIEQLARPDVAELIAALGSWFPDIRAGAASCYLREDFYARKVFLAGEPGEERDIAVMLIRKNDELVAMWSCERNRDTRTLYGRLGAIAPHHRGVRLTRAAMRLGEVVGRAMGAGMIYGMATLKHPFMQQTLENLGWKLVGIAPYDRDEVTPGVVKRVFEALYVKMLADEGELLRPDPDSLTPQTRAMFELLYPGR